MELYGCKMSSLERLGEFLGSDDFRRAFLASLFPGTGAVVAYAVFVTDKNALSWWSVS